MLQIDYSQKSPEMGELKCILRVDGRHLFFQFNNSGHAQQVMAQLQQKGAIIVPGNKWIKVDMFGIHEEVKLGNEIFSLTKTPKDTVEKILGDFYMENFTKAGFKCKIKKLKA